MDVQNSSLPAPSNDLPERAEVPWHDLPLPKVDPAKEAALPAEFPTPVELPMAMVREKFLQLIADNQVVILVAETGAGKSTEAPLSLLNEGYNVLVTEPRRLASVTLATWVAQRQGCELGDIVGYRHAMASADSPETRLLYCTDGLELVRELVGAKRRFDVVVLDEFHESNLNMEMLLTLFKREISKGSDLKLVVQSATIDEKTLQSFLPGAAVLKVPGRTFPVTEEQPRGTEVQDIVRLLEDGHNVLSFQPGKTEIGQLMQKLESSGVRAKILPLHGDLTPAEQMACFASYPMPKCIVATNVAETAVTIPDITAVVDSGLERVLDTRHGVEGLYIQPISLSSRAQRKGRAGRVQPGIYIDHFNGTEQRTDYPTPEILRARLDKAMLQLSRAGLEMEELTFLHQPKSAAMKQARRRLVAMDCLTESGEVTPIGERVSLLPVSAQFGRMLVEAEKRNVLPQVMEIAAVLEAGTQTQRQNPIWRELCQGETESDVIAQWRVFRAARMMATDAEREEAGVHVRNYQRAEDILQHLEKSLQPWFGTFDRHNAAGAAGENYDRKAVLLSICAGVLDRIYVQSADGYFGGERSERKLSDESIIEEAHWVVGIPFDLSIRPREPREGDEERVLHLLTMATRLHPEYLQELAPSKVEVLAVKDMHYDPVADRVTAEGVVRYRGMEMKGPISCADEPRASSALLEWLTDVTMDNHRWNNKFVTRQPWPGELKALIFANRAWAKQAKVSKHEVANAFRDRLKGARSIFEAGGLDGLALSNDG